MGTAHCSINQEIETCIEGPIGLQPRRPAHRIAGARRSTRAVLHARLAVRVQEGLRGGALIDVAGVLHDCAHDAERRVAQLGEVDLHLQVGSQCPDALRSICNLFI